MGQGTEILNITLIGAGNLATNLGLALKGAGHNIVCVYSRTEQSACTLAQRLGCPWTNQVDEAGRYASLSDVAILSVKDSALPLIAQQMPQASDTLFLHTAGSMPLSTLPMPHSGVFYPMQTFSRDREADFSIVPTFLEVLDDTDHLRLENLALSVTREVHWLSSEQRKSLHLAAVFTCNFSNYCYDVASQLLEKEGLAFSVMLPLIGETTAKLQQFTPFEAQTGPAVRYDTNVIQRHLDMLASQPAHQHLYEEMSQLIHTRHELRSK